MPYTVGFGKHRERTLEWLFFNDPGYVWWMIEEGAEEKLKGATCDLLRSSSTNRVTS